MKESQNILDLTADDERRVANPRCRADEKIAAMIAEWRHRQATGDDLPRWGLWSEFDVSSPSGTVRVLYCKSWMSMCGIDVHEFRLHGPISSTDFRIHFENMTAADIPEMSLEIWAANLIDVLQVGYAKEVAAKARQAKRDAAAARRVQA